MPDNQYTLETCQNVAGALVVIDVCRAFTTAAFAFAAGAERILLAGTVEEALQLRDRFPGAIIMGESSGLPVPGFDLWNSPRDVSSADLTGKTVIQRTSAGTQGMVRSRKADVLVAGSFVVAKATVQYLKRLQLEQIGFVITGIHNEFSGDEDAACADYMTGLLAGDYPDPAPYLARAARWKERRDADPEDVRAHLIADYAYCEQLDRFNFAMPVRRAGDLLVMTAEEMVA